MAKAKECLKGSVIPLGLWSDATPMNWDRSESLELILVNLPGLPKDSGSTSWRFPCAAISHKNVAKGLTFNQIFEVLSWSFQQLFVGRMPCSRHDGKPFTANECSVFFQNFVLFWPAGVFSAVWGRVCFSIKTGESSFSVFFKPRRSGEPSTAPKVLDAMEYWQRCEEIGSVLLKLFACHHGHTNLEFV